MGQLGSTRGWIAHFKEFSPVVPIRSSYRNQKYSCHKKEGENKSARFPGRRKYEEQRKCKIVRNLWVFSETSYFSEEKDK